MNISFNEELTAMFEYPSESSLLDGTDETMMIIAKINEPESSLTKTTTPSGNHAHSSISPFYLPPPPFFLNSLSTQVVLT